MDFSILFNLQFWFSLFPGPTNEKNLQILGGVFLTGLFLFVVLFIFKNKIKSHNGKIFSGLSYLFLSFGLAGFAWLFFLYEEAYLLGARFWLLIIILAHCIWLARIILYSTLRLPKEKEEMEKKKAYRKYLP